MQFMAILEFVHMQGILMADGRSSTFTERNSCTLGLHLELIDISRVLFLLLLLLSRDTGGDNFC